MENNNQQEELVAVMLNKKELALIIEAINAAKEEFVNVRHVLNIQERVLNLVLEKESPKLEESKIEESKKRFEDLRAELIRKQEFIYNLDNKLQTATLRVGLTEEELKEVLGNGF